MVDLDNVQNYLDIELKKSLERDEFLCNGGLTGVYPSNSVVNVIPALRNTNQQAVANNGLAANPSDVNYQEPAYFNVSPIATGVSFLVQFPLKLMKGTMFSVDKTMFFGSQPTYLKIFFGPTSKICYTSSSNANPSAGTKISYVPAANINASIGPVSGAVAYNNNIQPVNLQLMLAVETNVGLIEQIKNKVASSGLKYMIPFTQSFKVSNTGTNQTISQQIDGNFGKTLLRVLYAPYNSQEDLDTAYDHANTPTIAGTTDALNTPVAQKLTQFYTQMNGSRIQNLTIDCTFAGGFLDYMSLRRKLRGSILSTLNVYQYNWFWEDCWSGTDGQYDFNGSSDLITGLPLGISPVVWSFVGASFRPSTTNTNTFNHYFWMTFLKQLTITPSQIMVE